MLHGENTFVREANTYLQETVVFYVFVLLQIAERVC